LGKKELKECIFRFSIDVLYWQKQKKGIKCIANKCLKKWTKVEVNMERAFYSLLGKIENL